MPDASVIILTWNGREILAPCLRSVLAQRPAGFEVLVVDNGSTDRTTAWLAENFIDVKVLPLPQNLGFAGGNNKGVAAASGRWIILLNDDTIVEPGWLQELLAPLQQEQAVLVSSRVYTQGIDARYYEKNGSLSLLGYNIMHVFDDPEILFSVNGCAVAFPRQFFPQPFDADYFFYSEDVYLSLKARFMGLQVKQAPRSVVHHVGSASTRRMPLHIVTFHQERNRILNLLLFFSPVTLLKLAPLLVLDFAAKFAAIALSYLNYKKPRRKSLSGFLQAYGWLLANVPLILSKRAKIQQQKKVEDKSVLAWMSGKFVNGEGMAARFINAIALAYCSLTGLRIIELQGLQKEPHQRAGSSYSKALKK